VKKMFKPLVMLTCVLCLAGCTTRLVDFTMISTKNIDLSHAAGFERGKSRISGEDKVMIIIFIPTGVPNIKEAIDQALESVPGAVALMDGVVTSEYFWILFGQSGYVVEGTPLIDTAMASNELESTYMIVKMNHKGTVSSFRYVNEEEFRKVENNYITRYKKLQLKG